jgi:hypothetical protein
MGLAEIVQRRKGRQGAANGIDSEGRRGSLCLLSHVCPRQVWEKFDVLYVLYVCTTNESFLPGQSTGITAINA